jgi:hypothetical protein
MENKIRFELSSKNITFAIICFCLTFSISHPSYSNAADFPQKGKSIQLLVGFSAGGSTDVGARILAGGLEKELGVPVVVVNKPGASGQIAYTALTQSARRVHDQEQFPRRGQLFGSNIGQPTIEKVSKCWPCMSLITLVAVS